MPVSYATVDIIGFFQQYTRMRPNARPARQWVGACPFNDCSADDDGFMVWPELTERGCHYHCRVCGRSGDALAFVREYEGVSHQKGCELLGISCEPRYQNTSSYPIKVAPDEPPPDLWQKKAEQVIRGAIDRLWSDEGKPAREYLHGRGFTAERIRRARLGYNPHTRIDTAAEWGIADACIDRVWLPRGIVIPWLAEYQIWKLDIRRGDRDIERDIQRALERGGKSRPRKYVEVQGSADYLYNSGSLLAGHPTLLVESELDALAALQSGGGDIAAIVATGSTSRGRTPRSIGALALASCVLVGFDVDENGHGDEASQWWLKALPYAIRWSPWAHDVNDMLQQGQDVRLWIELGVEVATTGRRIELLAGDVVQVDRPPIDTARPGEDPALVCCVCCLEVEYYSDLGVPFCNKHWQEHQLQNQAASFPQQNEPVEVSPAYQQANPSHERNISVSSPQKPPEGSSDLSSQGKPYWRNCSTKIFLPGHPHHCGIPEWFVPGTKAFEQLVKRSSYQEVMLQRETFLRGWDDVHGRHWCGQCYWHMRLMNAGAALGYPEAYDLYCLPETRSVAGYEAWLYIAQYGGNVLVQTIAREAEARLSLVSKTGELPTPLSEQAQYRNRER